MQSDAVSHYHWMTGAQFLNAVALGQVTPGPVVQTVAVVGYAAADLIGGILASAVSLQPLLRVRPARRPPVQPDPRRPARPRLPRRRRARRHRRHLRLRHPLTRALSHPWQYAVLAAALILLLLLRRGVVLTLLSAGAAGVVIALTVSTALR